MPTPKRGPRFGGDSAHQRMMMSNLAGDLFRHGRITTTEAKARMLRPYAEKLISKAKRGDLHARRIVLSHLRDRDLVARLFEEVAPTFKDRDGGYTRMVKLGPRKGDAARMAIVELVPEASSATAPAPAERRTPRVGRRRTAEAAAPVAAASEVESVVEEVAVDADAAPDAAADAPAEDAPADEAVDEGAAEE